MIQHTAAGGQLSNVLADQMIAPSSFDPLQPTTLELEMMGSMVTCCVREVPGSMIQSGPITLPSGPPGIKSWKMQAGFTDFAMYQRRYNGRVRIVALWMLAACGRLGFDSDLPTIVQSPTLLSMDLVHVVDVTPIRPGNTIIVVTSNIASPPEPVASISDDAASAYRAADTPYVCKGIAVGEIWYANADAPVTAISVADTTSSLRELWVLEVTGVLDVDTSRVLNDTPENFSARAPVVRPAREPALIVSHLNVPGHVSGETTGFTPLQILHGDDAAYAVVTALGFYGANWITNTTGTYCAATVAFD